MLLGGNGVRVLNVMGIITSSEGLTQKRMRRRRMIEQQNIILEFLHLQIIENTIGLAE